jgi:hypothetical protein
MATFLTYLPALILAAGAVLFLLSTFGFYLLIREAKKRRGPDPES